MQTTKYLVDLYIDANIVLALAFVLWSVGRFAFQRSRLRYNYRTQVNFTQGLMLVTLASPVLALALLAGWSWAFPALSLNASDLVLAQFLDGRIGMDAVTFAALLGARETAVLQIAEGQSSVAQWVAWLVVIGVTLGALRTAVRVMALRQLVLGSFVLRRAGRLDIRISHDTAVPFSTRGLWRRHVVLPARMVEDARAMQIALAHELQHMRRADVEWELGLELLRPLFFWNPAFGAWKRGLERLRELSVDQALLRRGRISTRAYANCLLAVCKASVDARGHVPAMVGRVPFLGIERALTGRRNIDVLRHRINAMTRQPAARASGWWLSVPLVAGALCLAMAVGSLKKPADWSQDRLMLSTIVNLERMESRAARPAGF
ncbi:M56 family metallopeptidase [Pseudaestuariivita sp.]|uniref:M56 family metallopeptidase n=1 Tax=Pseudaestuariivita sp. TaxID=2211669 RepID=UPI004058CE93